MAVLVILGLASRRGHRLLVESPLGMLPWHSKSPAQTVPGSCWRLLEGTWNFTRVSLAGASHAMSLTLKQGQRNTHLARSQAGGEAGCLRMTGTWSKGNPTSESGARGEQKAAPQRGGLREW